VAEASIDPQNGIVVASVYDLAATKAKAIYDRSEWKDYVDIAELLRAGLRLADIIGYATAVFDRRFAFPTPEFLRSLVWFEDGTASDVPHDVRRDLEAAVRDMDLDDIPKVEPFRTTITPWLCARWFGSLASSTARRHRSLVTGAAPRNFSRSPASRASSWWVRRSFRGDDVGEGGATSRQPTSRPTPVRWPS